MSKESLLADVKALLKTYKWYVRLQSGRSMKKIRIHGNSL